MEDDSLPQINLKNLKEGKTGEQIKNDKFEKEKGNIDLLNHSKSGNNTSTQLSKTWLSKYVHLENVTHMTMMTANNISLDKTLRGKHSTISWIIENRIKRKYSNSGNREIQGNLNGFYNL